MAPVYDFRHVELDKIGRGKRIVKPPGGECSDIFGATPTKQLPEQMTPRKTNNYMQSTIFSPDSPDSRPRNGDAPSPVTPSKSLDTQQRLFGGSPDGNTPRKVVNRQRSSIFEEEVDSPRSNRSTPARRPSLNPITGEPENAENGVYSNGSSPSGSINGGSPKGYNNGFFVNKISRNPITGEPLSLNGSMNGSSNASTPNGYHCFSNGHSSPETPLSGSRCRVPPGGKSSGIF